MHEVGGAGDLARPWCLSGGFIWGVVTLINGCGYMDSAKAIIFFVILSGCGFFWVGLLH